MLFTLRPVLELAALILGLVNGLILLWNFTRDRPSIVAKPIHPTIYQWWFNLPSREYKGQHTRAYGFIAYVGISNKGLRSVAINEWHLKIRTRNFRNCELKPINLPEPKIEIGNHVKILPIFGQHGQFFKSDMTVQSGNSISGLAYYIYECYGDLIWNPKDTDGVIKGKFGVNTVFNNKTTCKICFHKRNLEEITKIFPGIETIGRE